MLLLFFKMSLANINQPIRGWMDIIISMKKFENETTEVDFIRTNLK